MSPPATCCGRRSKGLSRLSPKLVLDLSETALVDSTGLSVLVRAHRALGDRGALRVRGAQPLVLKVLDQAGFAQIMTIEGIEGIESGQAGAVSKT